MPEYLAPGVYVEEVDTGSKPIEGVSTSTAGMVGVTERGPLGVPVLVTSYGEFERIFGGRLPATFGEYRYLPHAVEGFFQNGGRRLFIVRVLDSDGAGTSNTLLFARGAGNPVYHTRLLAEASVGATRLFASSNTNIGNVDPGSWLQVGSDAEAEYVQFQQITAGSRIRLDLALSHEQPATEDVARVDVTVDPAGPWALAAQADAGVDTIEFDADPSADLAVGELVRLNGGAEFARVAAVNNANVTLSTPLVGSHALGATIEKVTVTTVAGSETTVLDGTTAGQGERKVWLDDATGYAANEVVSIGTGPNVEIRTVVATRGSASITHGAYSTYPASSEVEEVTAADDAVAGVLTSTAAIGARSIEVDRRAGLAAGDVLRLGPVGGADTEYVIVQSLPNPLPGDDEGRILLEHELRAEQTDGKTFTEQTVTATGTATRIELATPGGAAATLLEDSTAFNDGDLVRVRTPAGATFFHRITGAPAAETPVVIEVSVPLTQAHAVGAQVVTRMPNLRVVALDPGGWGNRVRVGARDPESPLLTSQIIEQVDPENFRMQSSAGLEVGSALEALDANGAGTGTFVKVIDVDAQQNFLIRSADPLPAGVGVGTRMRTREFDLLVAVFAPADPARPYRANTVIAEETFAQLSMDPRHSRYVHKVIGTTWTSGQPEDEDDNPLRLWDRRSEGESRFIRIADTANTENEQHEIRVGPEALTTTLPDTREVPVLRRLAGGSDSLGTLGADHFRGNSSNQPESRTGIESLRNEEDISIVSCPGVTDPAIVQALIIHCERMRYRFAVLDSVAPPQDSLSDVQAQRQLYDSKYAALYYPWLSIPDPFPVNLANIGTVAIPPSGHLVGVYARTDIERGVHKAPANEVVRGISGLQRVLNKSEHDLLNPSPVNINAIRDFRPNNRGVRVWGGRCITSDTDWKYVNVRRLLIFIEASIDRGLQWVVFEPNAEPLWARVRRSISNFLTTVWRNGALEGTSVEEAFFVKCDRTTMTQTDIDNGKLICDIGVAPVKPAEYVIIRIGLWTAHGDD